ncbi:MAG: hypothetical protein P4M01_09135 [Acidobacteriota bacterium]|nr:hypothetical protein [Acidobacteriota bacterium]
MVSFLLLLSPLAYAGQFKVSSSALERTLKMRLFNAPDGRYYLRGDPHSACNLYVENPQLALSGDRVLVRLHTAGFYGKQIAGHCMGFPVSMNTTISLAPVVQGEVVGVADARIDRLSESSEVNFLLSPFLNHKLPANIQINAATMLRDTLRNSTQSSGYPVTLERLELHTVHTLGNYLIIEYDTDMRVD